MNKIHIYHKREIKLFTEELNRFATKSGYPHANFHDLNVLMVMKDDKTGIIIAIGGLGCYHGHWCMRLCIVHPKYRGLGFQHKLINARFNYLENKNLKHVNAWVTPSNTISLNNLIEEGFKFVQEKPRLFNGIEHYKLRKIL